MGIPEAKLQQILKDCVKKGLEQDAMDRATPGLEPEQWNYEYFQFVRNDWLEIKESSLEFYDILVNKDYSRVELYVDGIIEDCGLGITKDSQEYFQLCHRFIRAMNPVFMSLEKKLSVIGFRSKK